jgi:hypothetical protein
LPLSMQRADSSSSLPICICGLPPTRLLSVPTPPLGILVSVCVTVSIASISSLLAHDSPLHFGEVLVLHIGAPGCGQRSRWTPALAPPGVVWGHWGGCVHLRRSRWTLDLAPAVW